MCYNASKASNEHKNSVTWTNSTAEEAGEVQHILIFVICCIMLFLVLNCVKGLQMHAELESDRLLGRTQTEVEELHTSFAVASLCHHESREFATLLRIEGFSELKAVLEFDINAWKHISGGGLEAHSSQRPLTFFRCAWVAALCMKYSTVFEYGHV